MQLAGIATDIEYQTRTSRYTPVDVAATVPGISLKRANSALPSCLFAFAVILEGGSQSDQNFCCCFQQCLKARLR
jgi:hypothetical protein